MDSVTRVSIALWGLTAQTAAWIHLQNPRAVAIVTIVTIPLATVFLTAAAPMAAVAVVITLVTVILGVVAAAAAVGPLEVVITLSSRELLSVMRVKLAVAVLHDQE